MAPALDPGERWAARVTADLDAFGPSWRELVAHAATATSARPSGRWQERARSLLTDVGPDEFRARAVEWLALTRGDTDRLSPRNATALRGLAWMLALVPAHHDAARALGDLVEAALCRVAGIGPRSPKVANAAVYALSRFSGDAGLAQLVRLASRVRYRGTLNRIHDALDTRASALGLSREEIEELGIPTYGLTEVGRRVERVGDATAELVVSDGHAHLYWHDAAGATLAAVPAAVRREHADRLAELRGTARDIGKMLTAQRDRLDRLFVSAPTWRFALWQERYSDHPLLGTLARRLVWTVNGLPVGYVNGELRTIQDVPVRPEPGATVELWHPVGRAADEVQGWRDWLERHGVRQPFKQAHREVYRLTADEQAAVHSDRFAGHVLRQHQFHAVAARRGWRDTLRMARDDAPAPATRELPEWGLRAEFLLAPADDRETFASGAYQQVVTGPIRFLPLAGPALTGRPDPVPLDRVPPLVFSEILRDVDIAVGVASVGSDPAWRDGGPQGRYRDYWRSYRFGDLSAAGRTRRDVLSHLLSGLGVGDRVRVGDRFLLVHGDLHDYKIHLGSGGAVMSPDNAYLPIAPEQSARGGDGGAFVPFDDETLRNILGTALLLAHDAEISDPGLRHDLEQTSL